jgi:CDP-diacylglycerol--glycerol-3-phosphate 3-phosphatidyltransferase
MASIYDLKPRFQSLLRPLCQGLAARGVTANQITGLAALLSILHGYLIYATAGNRAVLLLLPVTLFIRMALNAVDGMLAREHNQKSRLGAILNETTDVISDQVLYLSFMAVAGLPVLALALSAIMAGVSELTGVVGQTIGASRRYDGPMGKSDRAFAFGLLAFLLGLGLAPGWWSSLVVYAVAGLLVLTIVNRARRALAEGERA